MSGSRERLPPRSIIAATSGNVLEWYDFTVYGFLTATLATQFFPLENRVASLLSTFAVLAVGYAARPIGSVIFGHIGDRVGRKAAMVISVLLMGGGSLAIAMLPTFNQIGITATVLLVLIRIVQGIAVAGEYTASGVLLVEQAEPERRALTGAWIACAMISGCLIGSAIPAGINLFLSADQMMDWGWRLAFAFGALVAIFSAVIRRNIIDTVLDEDPEDRTSPVWQSLRDHSALIGQMILLLIPTAVIYFVIYVYAVSFLSAKPDFGSSAALNVTTLNLIIMALFIPVCGLAADRFGLRPAFLAGAVATFILAGPCWWLMLRPDTTSVFLGQFGLTLTSTVGWALSITALTLMAPDHLRCSVVALGYNLSMALFGGTTPIVATYLVTQTGRNYAPVYYILIAVLLSLPIIWRLPKLIASTRLKNALA